MSDWINVKERLPRDHPRRAYLVCYRNASPKGGKRARTIRFAVFSGGAWRFIGHNDKNRLSECVTHWMRKPKLPPITTLTKGDAP